MIVSTVKKNVINFGTDVYYLMNYLNVLVRIQWEFHRCNVPL